MSGSIMETITARNLGSWNLLDVGSKDDNQVIAFVDSQGSHRGVLNLSGHEAIAIRNALRGPIEQQQMIAKLEAALREIASRPAGHSIADQQIARYSQWAVEIAVNALERNERR